MKVLAVSFDYPPYKDGGLARYSYELINALRGMGLDLRLIIAIPKAETKPEEDYIEAIELPSYIYNTRFLCYLFFSWKLYFKKIFRRKEEFDVFHVLNQFGYLFAPLPKSKLIFTVHNTIARVALHPHGNTRLDRLTRRVFYSVLSFWERHLCKAADKVITVSNSPKEDLIKFHRIPPHKIKTIYNGIDKLKFATLNSEMRPDRKNLLFVGRLVPRKGVEYLIEAVWLIRGKGQDVCLYIVGKGEKGYELKLKRLVRNYGLEKEVKFLGFVSDEELGSIYSEADIFVLPSLIEGFGLVLLEAMAYGKPVVASDIGGVNEVVRDGKDGILVKPKEPEGYAGAIIRLLQNDAFYNSCVSNVLDRVKHFSWEKCARETFELYKN